jgi:hypothetical protein
MDKFETLIEQSICAALRGERPPWPASKSAKCETRLRESIAFHGMGPLLSRRLAHDRLGGAPIVACADLGATIKDEVAIELARKHELLRVLGGLAGAGVRVLLLKGAALAYSIYPSPVLRPRSDTDLLIRIDDRKLTEQLLSKLGYEKPNAIRGELVKYQCGYTARDHFGIEHVLDVHWRISNTQIFSRAMDFDELYTRSVPIADLGGHARGLANTDALLLACMHRAHHLHTPFYVDGVPRAGDDRLIWLYDLHLLAEVMTREELVAFALLAECKGVRAVCRDGLARAAQCFGTRLPGEVLGILQKAGPAELSAAHLRNGRLRHLFTELRAIKRWRDRVTFLCGHLFPPPAYMLEKYAVSSRAWLPMLYLQRGIHGAWKRLLKP